VPTTLEVAQWMLARLEEYNVLYQDEIVTEIESRFGGQYVYVNEHGSQAIDKKLLKEFRRLTEESVVWEPGEKLWRKRTSSDEPGRRQSY
jgi:hypothetical protein